MQARLISVTSSPEMTAEQLIVYTARVSNPSNQDNHETAPKLIQYLIKNKHWSPFEMADMTVEIKTSLAVAQQILRHRSFSFQQFSNRYSEATQIESVQLRKAGKTNRQSSEEVFDPVLTAGDVTIEASVLVKWTLKDCLRAYNSLLEAGVARECARMVLPVATQTTLYMKGSVRSWIHYLDIRTEEHTQLEHRELALEIKEIFKQQFPNIAEALGY